MLKVYWITNYILRVSNEDGLFKLKRFSASQIWFGTAVAFKHYAKIINIFISISALGAC